MSLYALQSDFRVWLETGAEGAAARFAPEAQAGLLVYQNNYRASLMACLEEGFPNTLAWIGTEVFRSVAATLIDARPPDSWSLDHYGAHFPAALAKALPGDAEVAELAILELSLADAFVGRDATALTPDQLPNIDWDTAILSFVPTARSVSVSTNVAAIWAALASEIEPPPAETLSAPSTLLVWRNGFVSCFRMLELKEEEVTHLVEKGVAFADICSHWVNAHGQAEGIQAAGIWLAQWVADGLLMLTPAVPPVADVSAEV